MSSAILYRSNVGFHWTFPCFTLFVSFLLSYQLLIYLLLSSYFYIYLSGCSRLWLGLRNPSGSHLSSARREIKRRGIIHMEGQRFRVTRIFHIFRANQQQACFPTCGFLHFRIDYTRRNNISKGASNYTRIIAERYSSMQLYMSITVE